MKRSSTPFHRFAGVIAAGAVLTLTACGSTDDVGGASASEEKDVSEITIGFLQRQLDAPFYSAMVDMMEGMAEEQGFSLQVQNASGDPVTQLDQAQTMQAQGVDAIIINAISPETQRAQLDSIAESTPLIFVDTGIPDVGVTSVTSNNHESGRMSGELTAKRFEEGEEITVAILNGGANDEIVGPARQAGFLEGLENGGVQYDIVAETPAVWAQDRAVPATESMLSANPDVDLILGLNDAMALGALTVLRDQGNEDTLVAASADGQKEALEEIQNGGCDGQYVSTGLNSPDLAAERSMEIAIQIATGQATAEDFESEEFTQAAGIDCDNVDEFYDPESVF